MYLIISIAPLVVAVWALSWWWKHDIVGFWLYAAYVVVILWLHAAFLWLIWT